MTENTAIRTVDTEAIKSFCSINPDTPEKKAAVYAALTAPTHQLADHINEVFTAVDVYVEEAEILDENSGEVRHTPRVVFFDANGESYAATSFGVFNCLRRLMMVYGNASWPDGIRLKVKSAPCKKGSTLQLEVVK